jgi:hypothetical protein
MTSPARDSACFDIQILLFSPPAVNLAGSYRPARIFFLSGIFAMPAAQDAAGREGDDPCHFSRNKRLTERTLAR